MAEIHSKNEAQIVLTEQDKTLIERNGLEVREVVADAFEARRKSCQEYQGTKRSVKSKCGMQWNPGGDDHTFSCDRSFCPAIETTNQPTLVVCRSITHRLYLLATAEDG